MYLDIEYNDCVMSKIGERIEFTQYTLLEQQDNYW